MAFGLPSNLQKKVEKEVGKVFDREEFQLESFTVPEGINAKLPSKITGDNFFKVLDDGELLGYIYVDQAPSKTAQFDYLVVLDKDLKVVHAKVLIYREEYGGEIGSNRWLKQFLGKSGNDRVSHDTNIDGISGATISVRSMTNAMDSFLQSIGLLQVNNIL
jgi:Na+-translocating ferredoxin:NAD+ oxidoreductase RnfG subunit